MPVILPLMTGFVMLLIVSEIIKIPVHYRSNKIFGILLYVALLLCGMNLSNVLIPTSRSENIRIGKIILIPEEKEKTYKIVLGSIRERESGSWFSADGKILAYFEISGRIYDLEPGDWLIFNASLQVIEKPSNPMEFDYSKYCLGHGIYWKTYLQNHQWKKLNKNASFFSLSGAERIRMIMIRFMNKNHFEYESLIHSILLGYREGLSDTQRQYFAASGAMHVLAVSGLHVGIIYGMLVFVIRFISGKRSGGFFLLPLVVIWIYAMITGLTPSVTRASLMITLYVISKFLNRQTESLNIIFCSALILILAEPSVIHQVSFQLSFAAVTGISIFFKGLYGILKTRYSLPDKIISITCLSIAAQLFTFPLSMYYFHQFPNNFLITNVFAIPLTAMILMTGLAYWIFAFNTAISSVIAVVLDTLAGFLNSLVRLSGTLPFSVTGNIYIGVYDLIFIYCLIISLVMYFHTRRIVSLYISLICAVFICGNICLDEFRKTGQKEITVLSVSGTCAINLISGSQNTILIDDTSLVTRSRVCDHCLHYWNSKDLEDPRFIYIYDYKNLYDADNELFLSNLKDRNMILVQFCNTKIGILSGYSRKVNKSDRLIKLDLLIINSIHPVDLFGLMADIKTDLVVISRRVPSWYAKQIEMVCEQCKIPSYNVKVQGYMNLEL